MIVRVSACLLLLMVLGACGNENTSIHFGDVSLGQQLIDLKAALDQGAVSEAEYQRLKESIMALQVNCSPDG